MTTLNALRGIYVWIEPTFNFVAGRREYTARGVDEDGNDVFRTKRSYGRRALAREGAASHVEGKGYVKGFIDRPA